MRLVIRAENQCGPIVARWFTERWYIVRRGFCRFGELDECFRMDIGVAWLLDEHGLPQRLCLCIYCYRAENILAR